MPVKSPQTRRISDLPTYVVLQKGLLFRYSSVELPIEWRWVSGSFERAYCHTMQRLATVLFTCVANPPTFCVEQFVTRVFTRRVEKFTVLFARVANRQKLCVRWAIKGAHSREAVTCYFTIYVFRKSSDAANGRCGMNVQRACAGVHALMHACTNQNIYTRWGLCDSDIRSDGTVPWRETNGYHSGL